MLMKRHVWTAVACALACSGCTTMLSSMTPARVLEPGEVQVAVDYQVNAHTAAVDGVVDGVLAIEEQFNSEGDEAIGEEEFRRWLDSALKIALFRPGTGPELTAAVGVTDQLLEGLELGFRTDFNSLRGNAKLGLWSDPSQTQTLSLSLAYAHHLGVAPGLVEQITLTSFSRGDVEAQLLFGLEPNDFFKLTLAPRLIVGRVSSESTIPQDIYDRLPAEIQELDPSRLFRDEWLLHYGGNATFMAGYKYVFAALDIGLYWVQFNPEVLGSERDYSGGAFSFALGLSGNYAF